MTTMEDLVVLATLLARREGEVDSLRAVCPTGAEQAKLDEIDTEMADIERERARLYYSAATTRADVYRLLRRFVDLEGQLVDFREGR